MIKSDVREPTHKTGTSSESLSAEINWTQNIQIYGKFPASNLSLLICELQGHIGWISAQLSLSTFMGLLGGIIVGVPLLLPRIPLNGPPHPFIYIKVMIVCFFSFTSPTYQISIYVWGQACLIKIIRMGNILKNLLS